MGVGGQAGLKVRDLKGAAGRRHVVLLRPPIRRDVVPVQPVGDRVDAADHERRATLCSYGLHIYGSFSGRSCSYGRRSRTPCHLI